MKNVVIYKNMIKKLKNSKKLIVKMDDEFHLFDLRIKTTGEGCIDAFLWQKLLVQKYNFFITILGFIDGKIDILKKEIDWNIKFHNSIKELETKINNYLEKRKKVYNDFVESNTKFNSVDIIDEALKEYPAHQMFFKIYKYTSNYNYGLPIEAINAYNEGYKYAELIKYSYIEPEYVKMLEDIKYNKKTKC